MVSSLNPKTQMAMNAAIAETGSARPVMTVERQLLRKRKTTRTVRNAPSTSDHLTFETAASTRLPLFFTISTVTPSGRVDRSSSTRARIRAVTSVVLYPCAFLTSMPTASCPL